MYRVAGVHRIARRPLHALPDRCHPSTPCPIVATRIVGVALAFRAAPRLPGASHPAIEADFAWALEARRMSFPTVLEAVARVLPSIQGLWEGRVKLGVWKILRRVRAGGGGGGGGCGWQQRMGWTTRRARHARRAARQRRPAARARCCASRGSGTRARPAAPSRPAPSPFTPVHLPTPPPRLLMVRTARLLMVHPARLLARSTCAWRICAGGYLLHAVEMAGKLGLRARNRM